MTIFINKTESISGIYTEITSYETTTSDLQLLIFPGNPGLSCLYLELANILFQKTKGQANLHLISYAGFTKKKPEKAYSLMEELQHKIDVLNYLKPRWSSNARVVLISHSIGAWIAKELVKKFKGEVNFTLFMLFPFIGKSENTLQVSFSQFLANKKYTRLSLGIYKLIRKMPAPIIISIMKNLYSHSSEKAREIIWEYFISIDHILENIFNLAKSEFETLTENVDIEFFQVYKDSTILFYCRDDMWAPESQLEYIHSNVKDLKSEFLPMVAHDFCVNENQCDIVAGKILEYL